MRRLAPALLLLMASCGRGEPATNDIPAPANDMGSRASGPAMPTIVIAATGPGNCSASWDAQPVTPQQITQRSVAALERAIAAVGGAQNITEEALPVANVEAPAELSIACADTILFALQQSGMASVRLKPAGGRAPVLMDFPLDTGAPPPVVPMVMGLGAGGQVTWNSDPLDAAGLAARLGQMGSTEASDPMEAGPPPGAFELRVAREATVGQLHELLRTIRRYHIRPFVYLPSAEAGPGGAQVATPPPPPVPPVPRP